MSLSRASIFVVMAAVNTVVVLLGLWYTSASIAAHNVVSVFGIKIPAFLLGIMVVYIGVRSFVKLFGLLRVLKNQELRFSWQNFKRG